MGTPSHPKIYDAIGHGYATQRRSDPRIARQIHEALGDAETIVNVGAGAGAYEPLGRRVVAVEPSREMIAQRGAGPALRGVGESLPFPNQSFDAALASLTIHHWRDPAAGLAELRRVAGRVVVFTFDPELQDRFWLFAEYIPAALDFEDDRAVPLSLVVESLGEGRVTPVPIPADCTDGFLASYWRRPERYLDPVVRQSISTFAQLPADVVEAGMSKLKADLESGAWEHRHADLLGKEEMDWGYRLVVAA